MRRCDEVDAPFDRVIVAARRVVRTRIDTTRALDALISRRATHRPSRSRQDEFFVRRIVSHGASARGSIAMRDAASHAQVNHKSGLGQYSNTLASRTYDCYNRTNTSLWVNT